MSILIAGACSAESGASRGETAAPAEVCAREMKLFEASGDALTASGAATMDEAKKAELITMLTTECNKQNTERQAGSPEAYAKYAACSMEAQQFSSLKACHLAFGAG